MTTMLRSTNGTTIGELETDPSGRQTLRDGSGTYLGEFDPATNATRTANGTYAGEGNLLAMLLGKDRT